MVGLHLADNFIRGTKQAQRFKSESKDLTVIILVQMSMAAKVLVFGAAGQVNAALRVVDGQRRNHTTIVNFYRHTVLQIT